MTAQDKVNMKTNKFILSLPKAERGVWARSIPTSEPTTLCCLKE